jgi:5'-nucleotidase/UDP-sugar diphosphatase
MTRLRDRITRKHLWILLAIAGLTLAGCGDDNGQPVTDSAPPVDAGPDGTTPDTAVEHKAISLNVAHVNDTHSQFEATSQTVTFDIQGSQEQTGTQMGGYPRLITKIKELQSNNPKMLTLHAGDAVQGTLYFVEHGEKADVEMLNLMKLDAFVLGNHEFDRGPQLAADLIQDAQFPVLGANVDASNEPLLKDKITPYVIKDVDGEKVAILGLLTETTAEIAKPGNTVTFEDPVTKAKALVTEVEGQGINKIILLSHLGYDKDIELAKAVAGIDVIVGGHSHTLLGESKAFEDIGMFANDPYPTMAKDPDGKDVCIVQAWSSARAIGLLDVDLDVEGYVTKCQGKDLLLVSDSFTQYDPVQKKVVAVDATKKAAIEQVIQASPVIEVVAEDSAALAKVTTYKAAVDALMTEEVPGVDVVDDLWHVRIPGWTHPTAGVMDQGSYIAPHVAKSLLFAANNLALGVQVSVMNAGGVRCDVPKGKLTMGKVYELLPFFNTLYVIKVTGQQLSDALDAAVSGAVDDNNTGRFPYVGGARYTADMTKPVGQRITVLEVKDTTGAFVAADPTKEYTVATNSFLAGGGDGYTIFESATYRKDINHVADSDAFIDYAKSVKTLTQPADTGVTFIPPTP